MTEHGDTSPEAAEILRERLRRMTPSQRVELALARLLWGDDLWQKVYPDRRLIET